MLLIAPDFRCATGQTPALVARHGRRFRYQLFAAREVRFRRDELRRRLDRADVVHWHANLAHFPELAAEADSTRALRIATVHHLDDGDDDVLDDAVAHSEHLHVPCRPVAHDIRARGASAPVAVIPYLLDAPRRPPVRTADGRWVVGWCGNTTGPDDRKRLGVLIDALARLADRRPVLALQGFVDGSVIAVARAAGLAVRHTDARPWPERWAFYGGIDVYCSPSAVEGGPLPVFEAAAVGVPVVTTPVGMAAALVHDGGAWGAPVDDPDALAAALAAVADASVDERAERQGRAEAVLHRFEPERSVPRYEATYAQLLGVDPTDGRRSWQPVVERARLRPTALTRRWRSARIRLHQRRHGAGSTPYGWS